MTTLLQEDIQQTPVFAGYGSGHRALDGPMLKLFQDLDKLFLHWASDCGAREYHFPVVMPASELNKISYFKSFPHHLTFAVCLDTDHDNLMKFVDGDPIDAEGAVHLTKNAPIKNVLTPAACYHFYINFQHQSLDTPRYVTTRAACFRQEKQYQPLRRQWSFSMREIVCLGTSDEVTEFLASYRRKAEHFFSEIGLPVKWEKATDPFFNPQNNPKYIAQMLDPVKTEMVFDNDLAIGSVNFHRNYFGEAFHISRDGEDAYSGCIAFGLERWILAIKTYFGENPDQWPDITRMGGMDG